MQNNGGFTLIELILVTVIIGILAGMVVVTFGGRVGESQVRAAKGDIASFSKHQDLLALEKAIGAGRRLQWDEVKAEF